VAHLPEGIGEVPVDFEVQRSGHIGSPRAAGLDEVVEGQNQRFVLVDQLLAPPPLWRTDAVGSISSRISFNALCTVERAMPAVAETTPMPPRPIAPACASASTRRWSSSSAAHRGKHLSQSGLADPHIPCYFSALNRPSYYAERPQVVTSRHNDLVWCQQVRPTLSYQTEQRAGLS
jgi:hypothetical protein